MFSHSKHCEETKCDLQEKITKLNEANIAIKQGHHELKKLVEFNGFSIATKVELRDFDQLKDFIAKLPT